MSKTATFQENTIFFDNDSVVKVDIVALWPDTKHSTLRFYQVTG